MIEQNQQSFKRVSLHAQMQLVAVQQHLVDSVNLLLRMPCLSSKASPWLQLNASMKCCLALCILTPLVCRVSSWCIFKLVAVVWVSKLKTPSLRKPRSLVLKRLHLLKDLTLFNVLAITSPQYHKSHARIQKLRGP